MTRSPVRYVWRTLRQVCAHSRISNTHIPLKQCSMLLQRNMSRNCRGYLKKESVKLLNFSGESGKGSQEILALVMRLLMVLSLPCGRKWFACLSDSPGLWWWALWSWTRPLIYLGLSTPFVKSEVELKLGFSCVSWNLLGCIWKVGPRNGDNSLCHQDMHTASLLLKSSDFVVNLVYILGFWIRFYFSEENSVPQIKRVWLPLVYRIWFI